MKGLVGQRHQASRLNRLIHQEEDHLLFPFHEHCPVGYNQPNRPRVEIRGDWQGEYLGTWLDAAILTAWNQHDQALEKKIEGMVTDWLSTQQEDGYLGTFDEADRWKSWDIWDQAHDLIGLYSYYKYTGKEEILQAAIRVAERVLKDFGPGKRAVYETGPGSLLGSIDRGMASSAFLEPLMWLYWETGNAHYVEFGRWLVDVDWEGPGGSQLVSCLRAGKGVAGVPYPKGIEMLICFAGMVELYRATGERNYLDAVLIAWKDIVEHHLYLTGTASTGELFTKDYVLRNDGVFYLGETCVSMGWLYLNLSLGRLLGEARFFDMAEQTLYNHLLTAQSPDGHAWAYYVGLRDSKRYRWHTDPECCPSRGVRALAVIPQHVICQDDRGVYLNFYEPSETRLALGSGAVVKIAIQGNYPFDGDVAIKVEPEKTAKFTLNLRLPGWSQGYQVWVNGGEVNVKSDFRGYLTIRRAWNPGDTVRVSFAMPVRVVVDLLGNNGKAALTRGPLVYAADSSYLPRATLLDDVILALDPAGVARNVRVVRDEATKHIHLVAPRVLLQPAVGKPLWAENERYFNLSDQPAASATADLELVPFFDAGNRDPRNYRDGINSNDEPARNVTYQVWLPYQIG
jgi:DUF1680 family protein